METLQKQLDPRDGHLIQNYFAFDHDLFALAQHENLPLHALLNWFTQDHIQHAIELITRANQSAHKAAALAHLRRIADTTKDPIERRRAATTLLRNLQPAPRRAPTSTAPSGTAHVSKRAEGEALDNTAHAVPADDPRASAHHNSTPSATAAPDLPAPPAPTDTAQPLAPTTSPLATAVAAHHPSG